MSRCMRTTIRLSDDLLAVAKKRAADSGRTLTALIEESLREALGRRAPPASKTRIKLTTFRGNGLRKGIDLDDGRALADAMDRP